jgi:hypothetical protein
MPERALLEKREIAGGEIRDQEIEAAVGVEVAGGEVALPIDEARPQRQNPVCSSRGKRLENSQSRDEKEQEAPKRWAAARSTRDDGRLQSQKIPAEEIGTFV